MVRRLTVGLVMLLVAGRSVAADRAGQSTLLSIDLARKVIQLTGCKSQIVFKPLPQDDPKVRQPDIGMAKRTLGWSPKVPLEEGLARTIEYFLTAKRA